MNYWIKGCLAVGLLFYNNGCGTSRDVFFNYDKNIDFTSYNTFAWLPDSSVIAHDDEQVYDTDIVRNNAKNYINHALSHRGYLVDIDSPDVVIQLILLNEKKERISTHYRRLYSEYYFYNPYYFPYYYPRFRYYTWYGWGHPPFWDIPVFRHTESYINGTITLNMYDRRLKRLVWSASAEGNIYNSGYIQYDVHPAIGLILDKLPVKVFGSKSKNIEIRANGVNREEIDSVYPSNKKL